MRLVTMLVFTLLLAACSTPAPESETAAETTPSAMTSPPGTAVVADTTPPAMVDLTDDDLAAIRADYQRIEAARRAGTLNKDSLSYSCEDSMTDGNILLFSDETGVVLANHSWGSGSHGGASEQYYFRNGTLVFHFLEAGHWQFGGQMKTLADGTEVPGTIDYVTEERRYYTDGKIIKALTKSYSFGSDEDRTAIANAATINDLNTSGPPAGKPVLDAAIATGKVDCALIAKMVEM